MPEHSLAVNEVEKIRLRILKEAGSNFAKEIRRRRRRERVGVSLQEALVRLLEVEGQIVANFHSG